MKNSRAIACSLFSILMLLLLVPASAHAAPAPVEELGGKREISNSSAGNPVSTYPVNTYPGNAYPENNEPIDNSAASNDPYYRMQLLMEELRQLRGLLEEQSNELSLLKKRQREDYLDLDRRLSALAGGGLASAPSADIKRTDGNLPTGQLNTGEVPQAGQSELQQQIAYDRAYGLLKARQIDEAKAALKQFLQDYPQGPYTANAHYWLGEVYLLGGELPEAAAEFSAVVQKYPGHRKVNDATFKLGKVYHLQNQLDKSRMLLERVAEGSDSAARLAQDYLLRHF